MKDWKIIAFFGPMIFLGFIAMAAPAVLFAAWVEVQLWGWFISPFFGVRELTIPYALGISMTVSLMFGFYLFARDEGEEEGWSKAVFILSRMYVAPLFAWGFGWVIFQFV